MNIIEDIDLLVDLSTEALVRQVLARQHRMERTLNRLLRQGATLMADLGTLEAEVAQNGDAVASAVTLLGGLAQQIRDLSTDPAAIQALADQLDANTNNLAAAVVANTTPVPAPPVEPPAPPA